MTRLFSGKTNSMQVNAVPSPKSTVVPLDSLAGIDLGIESNKNFDSMSTKSAGSSRPDDINDMSRLIDVNDDDEHEMNNILNEVEGYDFLNNW